METKNIIKILEVPGVWIEKNKSGVVTSTWFVTEDHYAIQSVNASNIFDRNALEDLMQYAEGDFTWTLERKFNTETESTTTSSPSKFDKLNPGDTVNIYWDIKKNGGKSFSYAEVEKIDGKFIYIKNIGYCDPLFSGSTLRFDRSTGSFICKRKECVPYIDLCDAPDFYRNLHKRVEKINIITSFMDDFDSVNNLSDNEIDTILKIINSDD